MLSPGSASAWARTRVPYLAQMGKRGSTGLGAPVLRARVENLVTVKIEVFLRFVARHGRDS